jgi:hypothetical protein
MPTQMLPEERSFANFERSLVKREFRPFGKSEFSAAFPRLGLVAPSPREGREIGYSFTANGLEVVVWTTFVAKERAARSVDAGWVLIKDGDVVRYFSRPLHRTKNFLHNLLLQAAVARLRVLNRPQCPCCKAFMQIANGKGLKSRYWICRKPAHTKPVFCDWDVGLPAVAVKHLQKLRVRRQAYRKRVQNGGSTPVPAVQRRKGWSVTKPENILQPR